MISFSDITKLFSFELKGERSIEIEFRIEGYSKYQSCWMGKMPDETDKEKELYWYGLASDGSEAYDYDNFQDFSSAPVFCGKSLEEIWDKVEIVSVDGCDPNSRVLTYL